MELVEILRRRLHSLIHLFGMRPVAHACGALPDGFAADNGCDLSGPFAGREAGFTRLLQIGISY